MPQQDRTATADGTSLVVCVGESAEHPPGSTVRVDVDDAGTVTNTTYVEVPGQLVVPLPSSSSSVQVLVDGVPWLSGPAADDPLHAHGSGFPTASPRAP
ncbi:hypothetical protein [Kineococcus aurantiacus]|uniref:Uncharacterized protein n=1 Tax=Kineococcus aurantiacus TaxID=37633 RepID=A0A7Y9J364_9ACTN|nr:hypothetical protein [Kineococcus aurantiacus]NYD24713.1 hypothetical protein [Kineococcus aurantiacus]